METPKTVATWFELKEFLAASTSYFKGNPEERSKVTFAAIKQSQKYQKKSDRIQKDLNREDSIIRNKYASVDDKGNVIEQKIDFKAGNKDKEESVLRYQYKPENFKKMQEEIDKLAEEYENTLIDIQPPYKSEPFYLDIPENFDFRYVNAFKKFIFNPELSEDEELEAYLSGADDVSKENGQSPTIKSVLKKNAKD